MKRIKRKPRLLFDSEASFLKTGFSKIAREILPRLHEWGNVEVIEFGSYAQSSDERAAHIPWTFYGTIPEDDDEFTKNRLRSSAYYQIYGQFGAANFEQVLLASKPDAVFSITDPWMNSLWQIHSPYKNYYKYILCPTIDGAPQRLEWLDSYRHADTLFTYTKFAKDLLEEQAPDINVTDILRPGVNPDTFCPEDQATVRNRLGIDTDINIVCTVMRNQKRKLFPDLIEGFELYLKHCAKMGNEKLASNTYLYLHTSYPDVGYDLGKFALKHGLGHRILFTYVCGNCKKWHVSFFKEEAHICPFCKKLACHMPNTQDGVEEEDLRDIYNASDVYVGYSVCEGLSMGTLESRACGLPMMCVDYSAVHDQAHEPGGFPVPVQRFYWETSTETEQARALPDNQAFAVGLYSILNKSKEERYKIGMEGREYVKKNYSFDRAAKLLEDAVLSLDLPDHSLTWDRPLPKYCPLNTNVPQNLSASQLVDWCIDNILGQPEWKLSFWRDELIKSLNCGARLVEGSRQFQRFTPNECINYFVARAKEFNFFENQRVNLVLPQKREIRMEMV